MGHVQKSYKWIGYRHIGIPLFDDKRLLVKIEMFDYFCLY